MPIGDRGNVSRDVEKLRGLATVKVTKAETEVRIPITLTQMSAWGFDNRQAFLAFLRSEGIPDVRKEGNIAVRAADQGRLRAAISRRRAQ